MTVLFSSVFSGIELIWDRQFGFLKETLVAPVSRLTIMFGRVLGGATVAVSQGLILLVFCLLAGFRFPNFVAVPMVILIMALIAVLFTALGTAIASPMRDFQGFQLVMNFLVLPMFFLSGALFPLGDAPWALRAIARVNPLSYGVDALRGTLGGIAYFHLATDLGVLAGVTAGLLFLGGYLFSRIEL
jgi:ABC-2 type transport system permease protein